MTIEAAGGRGATAVLAALVLVWAVPAAAQPRASQPAQVVTLERALELALVNSRDLRDAELQYEAATRRVREAWSSVYPTLDLSATYTRNLTVPASFLPRVFIDPDADPDDLVRVQFGADNNWALQLRAEQPLFQASAFIGVGAADRYRALQQEGVRGRAIDIAARVKIAYYDVLLAQQAVTLGENTVRRIRQTLEETRRMNEAGLASSYDVLRLEVELANVEPQLRRSRNAAAGAKRRLAIELGLDDVNGLEVEGTLADVEFGDGAVATESAGALLASLRPAGPDLLLSAAPERLTQEQALELARAARSDLRQLDLTASLRRAEIRAEQSEYLPRLSVFGVYSINAQQSGRPVFFGDSEAQRAYGRQVGVQLTVPLFSGMRRPARIAQTQAELSRVLTQRALLEDQVENDVRTLLDDVQESAARGRAQRFALQQATRGYDIARAQYREGISSQLEVTDAEVALRQSEFNFAEAVYDYLVARARLDQALGLEPRGRGERRIAWDRENGGR
jgi:outer membrane protein